MLQKHAGALLSVLLAEINQNLSFQYKSSKFYIAVSFS